MQWFYDLKMSTKLLMSAAFVAVVAGFIGYEGLSTATSMNDGGDVLYNDGVLPFRTLVGISVHYHRMRSNMLESIAADDPSVVATAIKGRNERIAVVKENLSTLATQLSENDEKALYQQLVDANNEYLAQVSRMDELVQQKKRKEALAIWFSDANKARVKEQEVIESLVALLNKRTTTAHDDLQKSYSASRTAIVLSLVLGVLSAIGLGLFMARIVTTPLREVVTIIETADLNSRLDTSRKDEIGDLQRSFGGFVQSIKATLIQVAETSSAVADASNQISSSTEEIAAGSQEQTSQAGEVASAVEEMTKTIVENSKNAGETAATAKLSKQAAAQGGQVVADTVEGMKRIAAVVNKSAETVRALGKSSDQIGEIIAVIDDIADQTNLLALNAAIEAARAGEQGRGFAVVADEVRKLAERTTKATKEIAGMIRTIQSDTAGAVGSMEEGTKEVDEGIKLADKAGHSLQEIVQVSQKVTDMVTHIAAASEQQAGASEQISKNVEAISTVTQQTASGTQQIARAAEDLTRLTGNLQELLSKFKLDETTDAGHKRRMPTGSERSKIAVRSNGALVHHA